MPASASEQCFKCRSASPNLAVAGSLTEGHLHACTQWMQGGRQLSSRSGSHGPVPFAAPRQAKHQACGCSLTPNLMAVPLWNSASATSSTVLMKCAWPASNTQCSAGTDHAHKHGQGPICKPSSTVRFSRHGTSTTTACVHQPCMHQPEFKPIAPRMKFSSSAPPLSTSTSSICSPPVAACVCASTECAAVGAWRTNGATRWGRVQLCLPASGDT